jgi:hypothetical protein
LFNVLVPEYTFYSIFAPKQNNFGRNLLGQDPAPGKNFDAAPAQAPAPAPTLLYSKAKFLKLTKV